MKIRFFYALAALLLSVAATAQSTTISGRVLFSDKSPVMGANVSLKGSLRGATADAKGRYELKAITCSWFLLWDTNRKREQ